MSGLELLGIVLLSCVAIILIAVGGVVLIGHGAAKLGGSEQPQARRLCIALIVALVAAFASLIITGGTSSSAQVFAQGGAERWLASPVIYSAFGALLLFDRRSPSPLRAYLPAFLGEPTGLLVVLTLAGAAVELLTASASVTTIAQGVALAGGFGMFLLAGRLSVPWDARTRQVFGLAVGGAAVVATLLGRTPASLPALVVPVMATAVGVGLIGTGVNQVLRAVALAGGIAVIAAQYIASATSNDPSDGLDLQIVLCGSIVLLAVIPRRARALAALAVGAAVVIGIATSPLPGLTVGQGAEDPDLTLSQRAFETEAVWQKVSASPVTLIFGDGPGATVDLTNSPDRATLAASGRTLSAVPSVHLLTSYLLLKFGLLGLGWLVAVIVTMVRLTAFELRPRTPSLFGVLLLTLAWACFAAAVPAATFFLSDPLCALSIGLLLGREISTRTATLVSTRNVASTPRYRLTLLTSPHPRRVDGDATASRRDVSAG